MEFLLWNSVLASIIVGALLPICGIYVVLRRLIFLGVALPPVASCGIAAVLLLEGLGYLHLHDPQPALLAGAFLFTLGAVAAVAWGENGRDDTQGHIGLLYAVGSALSLLLLARNPAAEAGLLHALRGEIVAVSEMEVVISGLLLAGAAAALIGFRRQLLLVAIDREYARVLKTPVHRWDLLLYVVLACGISVGVMIVGAVAAFAFLVFPVLAVQRLATRSWHMFAFCPAVGASCGAGGFLIAYHLDLPAGPVDTVVLAAVYGLAVLVDKGRNRWRQV